MALIKLNPAEVTSYGEEIKTMAGQVENLLGDIETLVSQINGGWEGLGNSAFAAQYAQLKVQLKNLPEIVTGVGAQAVTYGNTMAEAERQLGQQA